MLCGWWNGVWAAWWASAVDLVGMLVDVCVVSVEEVCLANSAEVKGLDGEARAW